MGNPVVMNCAKIVMKCSSLSMILYLTRIWAKRRLRFFAAFPGECVNGKQGKCSRACDFCSAKMLVGVAPQTRRKPPDTCPEAETAGERSWPLPRVTGPPPGPASPTDRREGRLEHIAVEGYFPHTGSQV